MADLFIGIVFWVIHWVIVLPAALAVCTPWFLIAAAFHSGPYWHVLITRYRRLISTFAKFWDGGGYGFSP